MMNKTDRVKLNEQLDGLVQAINLIQDQVNGVEPIPEEPAVEETVPTPEEISINVDGRPDFYKLHPEQYAKMKPYYDPAREPFTTYTWFTTAMFGKDVRRFKPVKLEDGKMYRRKPIQMGPDWYWIRRGIKDVAATPFWYQEVWEGPLTKEMQMEFEENYKGGYRDGGKPQTKW